MYNALLFFHSIFRWLVLISLLFAIYRSYRSYITHKIFSRKDDSLRHWTATIAHIQLMIGLALYFTSPITQYFMGNMKEGMQHKEMSFFGLIHISLMLTAILIITIGAALAKRKPTDRKKFKTIWVWFFIGLLIILVAVPWPFSPLASREYFRSW